VNAITLLRLYPRAWRDRYGDEFVAMFGGAPLRASQTINIISGAIDARFSSDVRASTSAATVPHSGGMTVIDALRRSCAMKTPTLTTKDHLISAAVIVVGSALLSVVGIVFRRNGFDATGEFFKSFAFPASLLLSSHATYMKHQSWKAQVVVLEGTMVFVGLICWIATKI
jgi:hypothetical protein